MADGVIAISLRFIFPGGERQDGKFYFTETTKGYLPPSILNRIGCGSFASTVVDTTESGDPIFLIEGFTVSEFRNFLKLCDKIYHQIGGDWLAPPGSHIITDLRELYILPLHVIKRDYPDVAVYCGLYVEDIEDLSILVELEKLTSHDIKNTYRFRGLGHDISFYIAQSYTGPYPHIRFVNPKIHSAIIHGVSLDDAVEDITLIKTALLEALIERKREGHPWSFMLR